ncbi:MAG: zinc-dependent metalloprotease, partial [Acidobacteriota bacterium]|nr:zinc-dependent metalloprotease [Acidobacteriota bacterium]
HQYALAAAVNVIGSAEIPLSLAGDGLKPVIPWPDSSQKEALQLMLKALEPSELEIPMQLWKRLAPNGNLGPDPEMFNSSAGYLFSPEDGARRVSEIVVGGLLEPDRMERLAVLSEEDPGALSPEDVVTTMVRSAFAVQEQTPAARDLAGVVQTEISERLMILSVNPAATPEVQAAALAGVHQARDVARARMAQDPILARLDHEITLFLENPKQNTLVLKPSGAPPGPPV